MPKLEKALLLELSPDEKPETVGAGIPVQFNPASLKLAFSNQVEGGGTRGRQRRQFNGKSSTELSFDLHFDTADEALADGRPRSVRERTALVEKFVVPAPEKNAGAKRLVPPKVRFLWGDLSIDGIISSLSIDFDLFAPNGFPLRAKMGVSIKEQDAKYEIKQRDEASSAAPLPPGAKGNGSRGQKGGGPGAPSDSTGTAMEGESAADFARRMGLDPAAWRGLAAGLEDPLTLTAGLEIDFEASLSAQVGLGVSVGFEAGLDASLEASLGLTVSADAALVVAGSLNAGASAAFALTAAGGVSAALNTVESARVGAAAAATVAAFGAPIAVAAAPLAGEARSIPPGRGSARPALSAAAAPSGQRGVSGASAPDPRASSFGFGVPLRPLRAPAAEQRAGSITVGGLRSGLRAAEVPETSELGSAPWTVLPTQHVPRLRADEVQLQRRPRHLCGCVGSCRCRRRDGRCR